MWLKSCPNKGRGISSECEGQTCYPPRKQFSISAVAVSVLWHMQKGKRRKKRKNKRWQPKSSTKLWIKSQAHTNKSGEENVEAEMKQKSVLFYRKSQKVNFTCPKSRTKIIPQSFCAQKHENVQHNDNDRGCGAGGCQWGRLTRDEWKRTQTLITKRKMSKFFFCGLRGSLNVLGNNFCSVPSTSVFFFFLLGLSLFILGTSDTGISHRGRRLWSGVQWMLRYSIFQYPDHFKTFAQYESYNHTPLCINLKFNNLSFVLLSLICNTWMSNIK